MKSFEQKYENLHRILSIPLDEINETCGEYNKEDYNFNGFNHFSETYLLPYVILIMKDKNLSSREREFIYLALGISDEDFRERNRLHHFLKSGESPLSPLKFFEESYRKGFHTRHIPSYFRIEGLFRNILNSNIKKDYLTGERIYGKHIFLQNKYFSIKTFVSILNDEKIGTYFAKKPEDITEQELKNILMNCTHLVDKKEEYENYETLKQQVIDSLSYDMYHSQCKKYKEDGGYLIKMLKSIPENFIRRETLHLKSNYLSSDILKHSECLTLNMILDAQKMDIRYLLSQLYDKDNYFDTELFKDLDQYENSKYYIYLKVILIIAVDYKSFTDLELYLINYFFFYFAYEYINELEEIEDGENNLFMLFQNMIDELIDNSDEIKYPDESVSEISTKFSKYVKFNGCIDFITGDMIEKNESVVFKGHTLLFDSLYEILKGEMETTEISFEDDDFHELFDIFEDYEFSKSTLEAYIYISNHSVDSKFFELYEVQKEEETKSNFLEELSYRVNTNDIYEEKYMPNDSEDNILLRRRTIKLAKEKISSFMK